MRKANQEITDQSIIEEILMGSSICRLAMIDNGEPYLLPFNYGYMDHCLYIHSATSGRKIDVLRSDPVVSFEIEDRASLVTASKACGWSTMYRSLIGKGRVEILNDVEQKIEGLHIIMKQHGAADPITFEENDVKNMLILKVIIEEVSGKQSGNWDKIVKNNELNLETERLLLHELEWDDLPEIHALLIIPEVDEFNTLGLPGSLEDTIKILKPLIEAKNSNPRSIYEWKIIEKKTNNMIGLAGFTLSNDKFKLGEIYYKLHPDYWGRGYATEAAKRLVRAGFEEFALHKVEAGVAIDNIRSIRVLEKTGMVREGLRRKILPIRGKWIDNYLYAILETDTGNEKAE